LTTLRLKDALLESLIGVVIDFKNVKTLDVFTLFFFLRLLDHTSYVLGPYPKTFSKGFLIEGTICMKYFYCDKFLMFYLTMLKRSYDRWSY